ncbi:MAG: EAL domain-containing protein [Epulopiscium sp.]|nr:EAL domain-containing protein [Candidatus Epulonipiscium sp.]
MFIARQPIFNQNLDVFGYELLFRSDHQSKEFDGSSPTRATATVVSGLFESNIDQIVDDKCAFVNFDGDFIQSSTLELIEPHRLIIEVLEGVEVDDSLIARLKELKNKGYKIALDDFVESYEEYPLVPLADIIKFDIMATPLDKIGSTVQKARLQKKILLAEKIETEEEFLQAKEMKFHLFQGYFFSKPRIIKKSDKRTISNTHYTRLLSELKKEEPSYQILAEIIEQDVNLAYRLMRVASIRSGDDLLYSIKRALTYMGLEEIERWINILMLQAIDHSKPKELMRISLIRTKFAEAIANHGNLKHLRREAAMMGLFSTIDAILDKNMSDALKDISLPSSIKEVLIDQKGALLPVHELLMAYEKGDWDATETIANRMGIEASILYYEYLSTIEWARKTFEVIDM